VNIVDTFLTGLSAALSPESREELSLASGASTQQIAALSAAYPNCPSSLLGLVSRINGTYWQAYGDSTVSVLMLGSDVDGGEYPYYLLSIEQMLVESASALAAESIAQVYEGAILARSGLLGSHIDPSVPMGRRLCFAHCMNNGGTSILYIDFDPAPGGTVGQIVRFLHDPDNYAVIANSFDAYLQQLIEGNYRYVLDLE